MPLFRPVLTSLDKKETLRYSGMRQSEDIPAEVLSAALSEALIYAAPAGVWEIYDYNEPFLLTGDGTYLPKSKGLCRHLRGSLRVAVLAVTVGEDIEERVSALFSSGEYAKALLLDAAATAAVEQAADSVCAFLATPLKKQGLSPGVRFSPGYGDWDIKEQPEVLRLSGAREIGIDMTASCMLLPRKSITAALGFKPVGIQGDFPTGCAPCPKADCQLRRI